MIAGFSQNYTIKDFRDTLYVNGSNSDLELVKYSYVENPTTSDISINIVRAVNNFSSGWSGSYICTDLCYPDTQNVVPVIIPAMDKVEVQLHFMSDKSVGDGEVKLRFDEVGQPSMEITYIAAAHPVSVVPVANPEIKFYPNPANEYITVELAEVNRSAQVEVYNIIGKKLKSFVVNEVGTSFNIELSDLPKGAYFLRLKQDNLVQTKKFQKI